MVNLYIYRDTRDILSIYLTPARIRIYFQMRCPTATCTRGEQLYEIYEVADIIRYFWATIYIDGYFVAEDQAIQRVYTILQTPEG